jgi:putative spermidine/putrescine transport system substrate-binding protein
MINNRLNRRRALQLLGVSVAALSAGLPALAQQGRMTLATYGGDTQRLLEELVINPALAPEGIQVVIEASADGPREVKLQAERRLPRGSYDVVHCQSIVLYRLYDQGLIEKLDTAKIEKFADIEDPVKRDYAVPHTMTARVILYNTDLVQTPPTSYADLWRPEFAGKVGFVDQHYMMALGAGALAAGADINDLEAGKEKLNELKAAGAKVYASNEAFGQALATGEIVIGVMIQSRAIMWKEGGAPIGFAYPSEGVVYDWWGFAIPKNAQNKDAAYAFLNAELADKAQSAWAGAMWSTPPTRTGIEAVPADVRDRIVMPADQNLKILELDDVYIQQNYLDLREWWDREFLA